MWLSWQLQVRDVEEYKSPRQFWSSLHHVEYKFLVIPLVFLFLRVWSLILSILYDYLELDVDQVPSQLNLALLYLSVRQQSESTFTLAHPQALRSFSLIILK